MEVGVELLLYLQCKLRVLQRYLGINSFRSVPSTRGFLFRVSSRTVLRKDFAAMCDGCPVQMQTFHVAKPRAAAGHYFWALFASVQAEQG